MKFLLLTCIMFCQALFLIGDESMPIIRALIIGDTVTHRSKKSVQHSVWRMQKTLETTARNIDCPLQLSTFVDHNFTIDNIESWLHSLPKNSNDIMFFYYVGHGGQDGLSKPWPVLNISRRDHSKQGLGASAIVNYMKHNKQRLAILLFECCNATPKEFNHISDILGQEVVMEEKACLPGLKTLFLHKRGFIVAAASKPGEVSFYQKRTPRGGMFLVGFTKALIDLCKGKRVSWKEIFSETEKYCLKKTQHLYEGPQHPVFLVE